MAMNPRQKKKKGKTSSNQTTTEQRASKKQISTAAIEAVRHIVETLKPFELSKSQRNRTFALMLMDDCVFAGFDSRATSIELSQHNGKFKYKKDSPASVELKNFLEFNMKHLDGQTTRSIGRSCAEMITYGWSPHEMVFHKSTNTEYKDHFTLKKLAYISPLSLDLYEPWRVAAGGNSIEYLRQTAMSFVGSDGTYSGDKIPWKGFKQIDARYLANCSYSATSTTPYGYSPLEAAYTAWREKQLLQDYLLIGVTRDFSGTPVLRLPSVVLEAAEADPSSPEAQQVAALSSGMQEMHSGDSCFMILPSDAQSETGTGLRDYEIQFLGVDGRAKNFDITDIIEQKKKAIHMVLTTQHLLSGESGGGSYNLHEGQANTSALVSKRDNIVIDEMWNKVVFPKLLRLNSMDYKTEDLPVWEHGEAQPISLEEASKAFQRMQNYLPVHVDVVNHALRVNKIPLELPDNLSREELLAMMPAQLSKAGQDNGGTSGTGDTQSVDAGSDKNNENAA